MSLFDWIIEEPSLGLVALTAAVVYLITLLARRTGARDTFWGWLRHILLAVVQVALLFGLMVGCRGILIYVHDVYSRDHHAVLRADVDAENNQWGGSIKQYELKVKHYNTVKSAERIIEQNSIAHFNGQATLSLAHTGKPARSFNSYRIEARYEYDVVNEADVATNTMFSFPLPRARRLFEDFQVTMDGRDLSPELRFAGEEVRWWLLMQPGQKATIVVSYATTGMDGYVYALEEARELRDFHFTLTLIDDSPHYILYDPRDVSMIGKNIGAEMGLDEVHVWDLDRVVVAAQIGMAYRKTKIPYNPFEDIARTLAFAPNGYVILAALWVLSTLIRREPVTLFQLAALSGIGCLFSLVVAGTADLLGGLTGSAILGGVLVALLAVVLFHKRVKPLLEVLTYLFVALFTLAYPFQGLIFDQQRLNTIKAILWGVILIYLFGLTVFTQFQLHRRRLRHSLAENISE
ncbi:MAG: hypothetical protein JXB38_21750 [Anaerolineales bacterium]|nr:hypothetical protein [Anaerolineales bacterium]